VSKSHFDEAWKTRLRRAHVASVEIAEVSFAFKRERRRFGIAMDAMIAMIATTIISSMSVNQPPAS